MIRGMKLLPALALVLVSAIPAAAQDTAPPEHKQYITTNPLLLLGGYVNVEFERTVTESMTLGVTAATFDGFFDDDVRYTNGSLIARYYPQGRPLHGFYLGGKAGAHHVRERYYWDGGERDTTLLSVGVDLGYNWLLGKRDKFVFGLGGGAVRLFGGDEDFQSSVVLPSVRANVGIAF